MLRLTNPRLRRGDVIINRILISFCSIDSLDCITNCLIDNKLSSIKLIKSNSELNLMKNSNLSAFT